MKVKKLFVKTKDNQSIALRHYIDKHERVIILAHGFYNNKDAYLFRKMAGSFSRYYDVIAFDFRGHGKSSGLFSWTAKEPKDLAAVVTYAKVQGYKKIGLIGFSLGAAVSVIEASCNKLINSVVAVSAPYDFWQINLHFWEPDMLDDLKLNLGIKGKGKFIRPGNLLLKKIRPIDAVKKISPTPILFIHGQNDWVIKPEHSKKLFKKAKLPKKLLIIKGVGHADIIFDQKPKQFITYCRAWFNKTL